MFHQVKVQKVDMDSLRFLFTGRINSKCKIRYLPNDIPIFGVSDSLFCVNYALRSRNKFSEFNPAAAEKNFKIILRRRLIKVSRSREEAINLTEKLMRAM